MVVGTRGLGLLKELLSRWPGTPRVELLTTDGFLYPNAELQRRGLLNRKGFPESYDRRALLRFVTEADYPPFNYRDEDGTLTGFNNDGNGFIQSLRDADPQWRPDSFFRRFAAAK